jgi:hypothetical protein
MKDTSDTSMYNSSVLLDVNVAYGGFKPKYREYFGFHLEVSSNQRSLTLEDGTDKYPRNDGFKPPYDHAYQHTYQLEEEMLFDQGKGGKTNTYEG